MKISKYIEIFRALSYPELFSNECLDALKNIQAKYGQADSHHVIYEINLNASVRTLDFSYLSCEKAPASYPWYEFDYNLYSQGNLSHCYFFDLKHSDTPLRENEEAVCSAIGREKFEMLRQPLNNLESFLNARGLKILYLGNLDNRGYSNSVRIETAGRYRLLIDILRELSYSGDISLIEDTISKIEPYVSHNMYSLNFDFFADRISDKIGVDFVPFTSIKNTKDLINVLTANKLCLYEKAQGLIKWISDPLPEGILQQRIRFMKIQFEKNNIVSVKAYLMQSDDFPFRTFLPAKREK